MKPQSMASEGNLGKESIPKILNESNLSTSDFEVFGYISERNAPEKRKHGSEKEHDISDFKAACSTHLLTNSWEVASIPIPLKKRKISNIFLSSSPVKSLPISPIDLSSRPNILFRNSKIPPVDQTLLVVKSTHTDRTFKPYHPRSILKRNNHNRVRSLRTCATKAHSSCRTESRFPKQDLPCSTSKHVPVDTSQNVSTSTSQNPNPIDFSVDDSTKRKLPRKVRFKEPIATVKFFNKSEELGIQKLTTNALKTSSDNMKLDYNNHSNINLLVAPDSQNINFCPDASSLCAIPTSSPIPPPDANVNSYNIPSKMPEKPLFPILDTNETSLCFQTTADYGSILKCYRRSLSQTITNVMLKFGVSISNSVLQEILMKMEYNAFKFSPSKTIEENDVTTILRMFGYLP